MTYSHHSTATYCEPNKGHLPDDTSIYLDKRDSDVNVEFEELIASVTESGNLHPPFSHLSCIFLLLESECEDSENIVQRRRKEKTDEDFEKKSTNQKRKNRVGRPQVDLRCANQTCSVLGKKEKVRMFKIKYLGECSTYCEGCSLAIRNKWTCSFCKAIYTDSSHSQKKDLFTWINCDNKKCGRWTHLECEEKARGKDLKKCLADPNFLFYCSGCTEVSPKGQEHSHTKKKPVQALHKQEIHMAHDLAEKTTLQSVLDGNNKFEEMTSFIFLYRYSEMYQSVERLVEESKSGVTQRADRCG